MSLVINFFVWDTSGTEVSVKGCWSSPTLCTVGEAPSVWVKWFTSISIYHSTRNKAAQRRGDAAAACGDKV